MRERHTWFGRQEGRAQSVRRDQTTSPHATLMAQSLTRPYWSFPLTERSTSSTPRPHPIQSLNYTQPHINMTPA